MGEIKRITPEEVREAYKSTGIKPALMDWAHFDADDKPCGCALTAVYLSKSYSPDTLRHQMFDLINETKDGNGPENLMEETLDLDYDYITGFTNGFDDMLVSDHRSQEFEIGYEDGKAVRNQIIRFETDSYGIERPTLLL